MVAGVLQRLGVFMGERLQGADVSNPRGHYEDLEFQLLNKAILAHAGGSWRHPPSHEAIMGVTKFDRQMAALVARRDAEHELWGWKDPRTCLTLCKWAPLLSEPVYVVAWRDWDAIIASLGSRNGMNANEVKDLCLLYDERFMQAQGEAPVFVAGYERAVDSPGQFVASLADALGIPTTPEAIAFIDPSLDHSRVSACA